MNLSKDMIIYLSSLLDLEDILSLSLSCKKHNILLCNNQTFWQSRLFMDFNIMVSDILPNYTNKEYYRYILTQLQASYNNIDDENFNKLLLDASSSGDLNLIKIALNPPVKYIDKKAEINSRNRYATPIMIAIIYGHLHIVKYLVENGAYIIIDELINMTIFYHRLDIMRYLIENIISIDNIYSSIDKYLIKASTSGSLEVVEYLFDQNPNYEAIKESIIKAKLFSEDTIVDYLILNSK